MSIKYPWRPISLTLAARIRPGIRPKLLALQALYEGKKIIVGRDKLDVVKGVLQKVVFYLLPFCRRDSDLSTSLASRV